MAMTLEEIEIALKKTVREGYVLSVSEGSCSVDVELPDGLGGLETVNVPVLVKQSHTNKDYWLPEIGEKVTCVFLPPECSSGFCLGSSYADDQPPAASIDKRIVKFNDQTSVEYDRGAHTLKVECVGPVEVSGSKISIKTVT